MRQRLAAWAITGPLGHLAAGIADWLGGLRAYLRGRFNPHRRAAD
jgi:hypothetical protein